MRQRMALVGFTYLCATVAAVYFGANIAFFAGITLAAAFAVFILIPSVRRARVLPVAAFCAAVAMLMYSHSYNSAIEPLTELDGREINVTARVVDIPYDTDTGTVYTLKVLSHDNPLQSTGFKIRVKKTYAADIFAYDTVTCRVKLYFPEGGGYSSESYMLAKGIVFAGYIEDVYTSRRAVKEEKTAGYYIVKLREYIAKSIDVLLNSRSAGITKALLLGDKNAVNAETKNQLSAIGASHLIVVSGLHMSVIAFFAMIVFGMIFRKSRKFALVLSVFAVAVFMAVTGFTQTVLRSGIVIIIALFGQIIGAKPYKFSSVGFAALLILFFNPLAAGDIGILLSFTSSIGLMIFTEPIINALNSRIFTVKCFEKYKPMRALIKIFTASVGTTAGATVLSVPILIVVFKRVSFIAVISNILLIPAVEALLVFMVTALVLYSVPLIGFSAYPFAVAVKLLCEYISKITKALAAIPYAYINTSHKYIAVWLAMSLILAAITLLWRKGFKFAGRTAIASILILLVGVSSNDVLSFDKLYLNIIDADDGYAAVLNYNGNTAVIACCEDNRFAEEIAEYISVYTRNISAVTVASNSAASKRLCNLLLNGYKVDNVIATNENIVAIKSLYKNENCRFNAVKDELSTVLWGCIRIDTLNKDGKIYTYVEYYGKRFLILPGKADVNGIDKRLLSADICITDSSLKGAENIKSGIVIVSGRLDKAINTVRQAEYKGKQMLLLCKNGCIVFEMYRDKTPIMRRDLNWQ